MNATKPFEHFFMLLAGALLAVIVAVGFAKTYLSQGLLLANLPNPVVHVHAVLFVGWIALFMVQIALAASGHLQWHQKLGSWLFVWAAGMVCIAIPTLVLAVRRPDSGVGVLEFVGDVGQIALFSLLILCAYQARRARPHAHKRYIVIATATLMLPALARWPWKISLPQFALLYFAAPAVLIGWEVISRRRVLPSTLIGTSLMAALFIATVLIAGTPQAAAFVYWIRSV